MNKLLKGALISSIVIAVYGFSFHGVHVNPHDWGAVALWLPVYCSPILVLSGASYLSERGKE